MTADKTDELRRLEILFDAALEYPSGSVRNAWLVRQCASDAVTLARIRALLEDDDRVSAAAIHAPEVLPTFGPWRAVRLLGRGGMGVVYLAERADGAFRMMAAVKVVPLALASVDIEERFRRERQFLASLDHPKIARLIDGGVTEMGLPYLVMEFVDGLAIDRFCEARHLDARARIGLMRQVLDALSYVHGRQTIHRDLKASNIVVDAAGNAKLLDFGTARLLNPNGDDAITRSGVFAFTPESASPEQVQGKALSFASDIYSAGILLHRLLTGRHPYPLADYASGTVTDRIRGAESQPSGLEAPLEAILAKALRRNPRERYASVGDMDADLTRYLEGKPVYARPQRKLWVAAVLLMALAGSAGWSVVHLLHRKPALQTPVSIAVLPFSNADGDLSNQYFVDGVTEEFTTGLSRLGDLRVAAKSSAGLFGKRPRNIRDIGRQMNVSHVLEAGVERSGDRVKIVASLERTSDGATLWTNTWQRRTADLSVIETDLRTRIASTLGVTATTRRKEHVPPESAHEYYLKASFEADRIALDANTQAQRDFRRALELDPDYALAYAGLGAAIWNRGNAGGEPAAPGEVAKSEQLWLKAVQLDPGLGKAHVALAMFAMQYDWDWNRAERELRAALALGPNSGTEMSFATLCLILGRRTEADEHLRRAQDLDPLSSQTILNAAEFLALEGRFPDAREEVRKIAAQNPTVVRLQIRLNFLDAWLGAPGPAMQNLRTWSQGQLFAREFLAEVEAHKGNRDEALRIIRPLEQNREDGHIAYFLAEVYGLLDDEADTVKWLERAIDARDGGAPYIHVEPAFARMQTSPAFRQLKKRLNLDW